MKSNFQIDFIEIFQKMIDDDSLFEKNIFCFPFSIKPKGFSLKLPSKKEYFLTRIQNSYIYIKIKGKIYWEKWKLSNKQSDEASKIFSSSSSNKIFVSSNPLLTPSLVSKSFFTKKFKF